MPDAAVKTSRFKVPGEGSSVVISGRSRSQGTWRVRPRHRSTAQAASSTVATGTSAVTTTLLENAAPTCPVDRS